MGTVDTVGAVASDARNNDYGSGDHGGAVISGDYDVDSVGNDRSARCGSVHDGCVCVLILLVIVALDLHNYGSIPSP